MLRKQHPNTISIINFLRVLRVRVNKSSVKQIFETHPDWPSFLSISDSLNHWKIKNVVAKLSKENFDEIPFPFITYLKNREYPLAIVTSADKDFIEIFDEETNKSKKYSRQSMLADWDGTVLIAEKEDNSGEENYLKVKAINIFNTLTTILIPILLFTMGLFFIINHFNTLNYSKKAINWLLIIYTHLSISISLSALLVWYEIDNSNSFISKVCSSFSNTNCFAVLNSRAAKLFNIFSWSEIGLFYYLFGFFYFIASKTNEINLISGISFYYILSFWYPIYSIYYQWKVIKQWCVLCLAIQVLIICSIFIVDYNFAWQNVFTLFSNFFPLLVFIALLLLWIKIKTILKSNVKLKESDIEYNRIKFNEIVFSSLLKNEIKVTANHQDVGVEIGNENAKYTIIKVCNPYCDPCSRAHKKLIEIIEKNKNIKVKIIFNVSPDNKFEKKPVGLFLHYFKGFIKGETGLNILTKWHLQNKKNYDEFIKLEQIDSSISEKGYADEIKKMYNWCKEMNVHSTPTYFIQNNKMPNFYLIEEINYFLME